MQVPFLYKNIYDLQVCQKKVTDCVSVIVLRGGKHCSVVEITNPMWRPERSPFEIRNSVPWSVLKVTYCMYDLIWEIYVIVLEMSVVTMKDSRAVKVFQWPKRKHMVYVPRTEISAMFTSQWHEKNLMSKTICDGPVRLTASGCSILNMFSFKCMPFINCYHGWQNDAFKDPLFWMLVIGHTRWEGNKMTRINTVVGVHMCVHVCVYICTFVWTCIHPYI